MTDRIKCFGQIHKNTTNKSYRYLVTLVYIRKETLMQGWWSVLLKTKLLISEKVVFDPEINHYVV